ncbi:MAG: methyltransferase domain-containing protein [Myxococcales bacterium]|nr:methyltransferase domain-containing protein [Myxococcales bacterium]
MRRATRRQTNAPLAAAVESGFPTDAYVADLSSEAAYIHSSKQPPVGTRVELRIQLPTGAKGPIRVGGSVIRVDEDGFALRFEDLHHKDLSRLRHYAGFAEMDEAVVRIQSRMKDVLSGNLLPLSDAAAIRERLTAAGQNGHRVLVIDPNGKAEPGAAAIFIGADRLKLRQLEKPLSGNEKAIYVAVLNGPLHLLFEGLIESTGEETILRWPQRLYHNERRSGPRRMQAGAWVEMQTSQLAGCPIRFPVVDLSENGFSLRAPQGCLFMEGMRLPAFHLLDGKEVREFDGATIKRLTRLNAEEWLIGLRFADDRSERDAFADLQRRSVKPTVWNTLTRYWGVVKEQARRRLRGKASKGREPVNIARYKNAQGENVVALLNATFDINEDAPDVDVAVVVAPAFLKRKEVFSLLARTLVDNFKRQGVHGVVLRFDATHTVGESYIDPEMEARGTPYLKWTFSQLESDLSASLRHLEKRFRPRRRVVLTFSVAAMAARRLIADGEKPPVDLWIAPFGCPDAQDMFQNYLAGIDLFQYYLHGEKAEPFLIYGRLADPNYVFPDAMERGMAFLDQARADMERITIPVTWIVGTYDYMVTRERVRQLLNAPGGGRREIFELPSGHILKSGDEAIASFKLIGESIFRHLFGKNIEAGEPDMAAFARQDDAEWARVKKENITDATDFWNRHLFGTAGEREGYDVLLYNPDYVAFLDRQVDWLDLASGLRVADIGCGTGNFSLRLLRRFTAPGERLDLACIDLVPGAVELTKRKIESWLGDLPGEQRPAVNLDCRVMNLEAARLLPWRDFLQGRLHSLEALLGRVEGLHAGALKRLLAAYDSTLHRFVRGEIPEAAVSRKKYPALNDEEWEIVRDLSRASRFLTRQTVPGDLRPGCAAAANAANLAFSRLNFGPANRECRLEAPDGCFDRIGCSLVLSYTYDPLSILREFHRLLSPGGILVVSSLKPNFDSSKSYLDEARTIAARYDLDEAERVRLLDSLREFASFVGCVMELEDEGRFQFFAADAFAGMVAEAGFTDVLTTESFGDPTTAVIVRACKSC